MESLDTIAIRHQTDKATKFNRTWAKPHGYTPHYEHWFEPQRFNRIKVLEIGVGGGESIKTWLQYFPVGKIFGVDNQSNTNIWDNPKRSPSQRYTFVHGDQSHDVFWKCFIADYGSDWNIIIDDGSHQAAHIQTTFNELWPHVVPGGLYCIEDLAYEFATNMAWLKAMVDPITTDPNCVVDAICFSKELAIIRKKQ